MMHTVGLDGDDTLWHNEDGFSATGEWFEDLLTPWAEREATRQRILEVQRHNIPVYGFGAKSFALSMIETAIDLSDGAITTAAIREITEAARTLISRPAELIDGVTEVLDELAGSYRLLLITKGDHTAQEVKVATSGLAHHFESIEIVPHKDASIYRSVLRRHGIDPEAFTMVGNSLPSDVLPVLEIGGIGVHVPYHTTWEFELTHHCDHGEYHVIESLGQLPEVLPS